MTVCFFFKSGSPPKASSPPAAVKSPEIIVESGQQRRGVLPKQATQALKSWLFQHIVVRKLKRCCLNFVLVRLYEGLSLVFFTVDLHWYLEFQCFDFSCSTLTRQRMKRRSCQSRLSCRFCKSIIGKLLVSRIN